MSNEKQFQNQIERKNFPPYLCYGIIDETSERFIDDFHVVDYLMDNEKVLEVRINEKSVEIQDCWRGKLLGMSHYPTLQQAVLSHYSFISQSESPIHKHWVHNLTKRGNIYVEYIDIKKIDSIVYPAVFMIDVFIPIRLEDETLIDKIVNVDSLIFFDYEVLDSVLTWRNREDNKIIQENILLIKITVPIAFISEVFEEIKVYIHKEKMWRAFTQLHKNNNNDGSIKIFYGNENDLYVSYSLIIKNTNNEN